MPIAVTAVKTIKIPLYFPRDNFMAFCQFDLSRSVHCEFLSVSGGNHTIQNPKSIVRDETYDELVHELSKERVFSGLDKKTRREQARAKAKDDIVEYMKAPERTAAATQRIYRILFELARL